MVKTIVICSGGFSPLHSGHIAYLNAAKNLGDELVVGINSDAWLKRKYNTVFMPLSERKIIVQNLKSVDLVLQFNDADGTAIDLIDQVKELYHNSIIIFANGGDRTKDNTPEQVYRHKDIIFKFGVGGTEKLNSSSDILKSYK